MISSTSQSTRQGVAVSDKGLRRMLLLMCLCATLVIATVAAINLAVPVIAISRIHPSDAESLWVVDSYIIVFAGLLIPAGAVGDRYGRKNLLVIGLCVFAIGSIASSAAAEIYLLIAGRVIAGVGAACILPTTLSLCVEIFPADKRARAIATWVAATGLAGAVGNLGGGLLVEYLGWRGLFGCTALLAIGLAITSVWLPSTVRGEQKVDVIGSVLLVSSLGLLLYAVIEGPEIGWSSRVVLLDGMATVLVFTMFIVHQLKTTKPLLDPRLFRDRRLQAGSLGIAATFFGMFALYFVNAQYLEYVKSYDAVRTGCAILPLAVGTFLMSRSSMRIQGIVGGRTVIALGMVAISGGLFLLSLAGPGTPYGVYLVYLLVAGAGAGLVAPLLSQAVVLSIPSDQAGVGAGINSASRELGSALGVAILGTVLNTRFLDSLPANMPAGSVATALSESTRVSDQARAHIADLFSSAMDTGYVVVACVMAAVGLLVIVLFRPTPTDG